MTEHKGGAEIISPDTIRHVMRYLSACKYIDSSMSVLDAACGTGYGTALLSERCYRIIGVDQDLEALIEARENYDLSFMAANLLHADFHDMDAIVSIETIEHFSEQDGVKLLQNFYKWLSPGGTLVISTPYCLVSGPSPITIKHLWEYSLTDFERTLGNAGFKVEIMEIQPHPGEYGRRGYCLAKAVK